MRSRIGQKIWVFFFPLVIFFWSGSVVAAQQTPKLDLKTTVEKEVKVKKDGKWVVERIPVDKTGPGNVLVYTIFYVNTGKDAAVDAQIIDPIPGGVILIPETVEGKDADITCSIDNGRSWYKPPIMVKVKGPNGKEEVKPAPAEKYTHVKWVVKKAVAPGQSGQVRFKVTVK